MTSTPNEIGKLRTLLNERADFYSRPSDKTIFTRAFARFDMDLLRAYGRLYSPEFTAREIENAVKLMDRFAVRSMADSLEVEHMEAYRLVMRAVYLFRMSDTLGVMPKADDHESVEPLCWLAICRPDRAEEIFTIVTERHVLSVPEVEALLTENEAVHTRLREGML